MEPFLLRPAWKDYVWGGTKLKKEYGKQFEADRIAETWECSAHPSGESVIAAGVHRGLTLRQFLARFPQALGTHGQKAAELPILVKLIDAEQDLSVQVHPDDSFALRHEGELGKTEMWVILQADPGATLVYGFSHDVNENFVRQAIQKNTLLNHLQKIEVHEGDIFLIEPGTIHAIGGGVLLAEVQESSNITYRVYDYGRKDKNGNLRELHIEKALAVMDFRAAKKIRRQQRIIKHTPGLANELVGRCRYFQVERLITQRQCEIQQSKETFYALMALNGTGRLCTAHTEICLQKGNTVFVPAGEGLLKIRGHLELLLIKI